MNQQEIFEYIKKQYPANPERITQNGKQSTIFKNQRNNIPYAIFYQSDAAIVNLWEGNNNLKRQYIRSERAHFMCPNLVCDTSSSLGWQGTITIGCRICRTVCKRQSIRVSGKQYV